MKSNKEVDIQDKPELYVNIYKTLNLEVQFFYMIPFLCVA